MSTLIKNGRLVLTDGLVNADILMDGGVIKRIGTGLSADEEYDASGCLVFPGFIDAHTHLQMDNGKIFTADDFLSGTRAAVAGGTTSVIDFATQDRGGSLVEALELWHKRADGRCLCDYGFHMAIVDWNRNTIRELPDMTRNGVTSYKVYMAYEALRLSDADIFGVLEGAAEQGGIVGCHCENGDLVNCLVRRYLAEGKTLPKYHPLSRPDYVEAEAVDRYISIARAAGTPVNIVHLSTKKGLERILNARREGQKVYIETCPQYLTLTDEVYSRENFEGAKYVCSPPIRKAADVAALKDAASQHIDTVSTDHCSYNFKGQKELGREDFSAIPNGLAGIEHRPAVFYEACVKGGVCTEVDMAHKLSENAARLFGMFPKKGILREGSDADVTVFDPSYNGFITAVAQEQKVDHTPFEGFRISGRAKAVFLRGRLAAENGRALGECRGEFVSRGASEYI